MAFRVRWCKMKKNGWTTKKPLGLSVDFIYLKPRKTIKDVEGEDVFTGEEAAMKYLEKIDLAALRAQKQARRDGSGNAARRRNAAKAVKPVAAKPSNPSPPDGCPSLHPPAPVQRQLLETNPVRLCAGSPAHITPPSSSGPPLDLASSPPKNLLQADSPHDTSVSPSEHSTGSPEDSPISQRNLDPDFEEAELSSNTSDHSDTDNQCGDQVEDDEESSQSPYSVGQSGKAGIANDDDPSIFVAFESDAEFDDGDEDGQFVDAIEDDVEQNLCHLKCNSTTNYSQR
ncbi:hypothetical protein F444_14881 [Phytophthora nicotianae P1976]|uniref:Uncharacterized protein n=1 Tax=Phytophthora nicotianae P1976 TaxID=1317066 RepID=A0A080ZNR8_PHYNI|nr:hypothetical protein F444_14881 [Phytophthora nicotianae P1976]